MNERVIVSMTSYPKRITNIGKAIYLLLTKQTRKPDEIHLWLAEPEFPNREKDLPDDVNEIMKIENVFLHWLPKNTYCHKRHEIFRDTLNTDCVFMLDDDVKYNDSLIETVMNDHQKYPLAIINYEWYSLHLYKGKKIIYSGYGNRPPTPFVRYCGQSMIPANVYPKVVLSNENINIRDNVCPICDESWLNPWMVYNNIPIYCEHFGWGVEIDPLIKKDEGLVRDSHKVESNGLERRDNWLFAILSNYPFLMNFYKEKFNYDS